MFDAYKEPIVPRDWVLPLSMRHHDSHVEQVSSPVRKVEGCGGYGDGPNSNWGAEHPVTQFHLRLTLSTAKGGAVR